MKIILAATLLWWTVPLPDRPDTIEFRAPAQVVTTADPSIVLLKGPKIEVVKTGPNEYTLTAPAGWSFDVQQQQQGAK